MTLLVEDTPEAVNRLLQEMKVTALAADLIYIVGPAGPRIVKGKRFTPKKKRLIVTVGLPRSGKSTWCRSLTAPIVNPDAIRLALHGQRFAAQAEPFVWAIAYCMTEALFLAGHEVLVVDATNVTEKRRSEWKNRFGKIAEVEFQVFDTPPRECIRRALLTEQPDLVEVIDRMAKEWDLPRPEGWDMR